MVSPKGSVILGSTHETPCYPFSVSLGYNSKERVLLSVAPGGCNCERAGPYINVDLSVHDLANRPSVVFTKYTGNRFTYNCSIFGVTREHSMLSLDNQYPWIRAGSSSYYNPEDVCYTFLLDQAIKKRLT
jgi:hypothetical protein